MSVLSSKLNFLWGTYTVICTCAGLPGLQGAPGITPQPEEITAPAGLPGLPGIDGVPGFDGDPGFQGSAGKPGKKYAQITEMLAAWKNNTTFSNALGMFAGFSNEGNNSSKMHADVMVYYY